MSFYLLFASAFLLLSIACAPGCGATGANGQNSSEANITSLTLTIGGQDEEIKFDNNGKAKLDINFAGQFPDKATIKSISVSEGATPRVLGAKVTNGSEVKIENNNNVPSITLTVTSEDGTTTKSFTVEFNSGNSATGISALVLNIAGNDYTINAFNAKNESQVSVDILAGVAAPTDLTVRVIIVPDGATVVAGETAINTDGTETTGIAIVEDGDEKSISFTVTAVDGLEAEYKVIIGFVSNEANINELKLTIAGNEQTITEFDARNEATIRVVSNPVAALKVQSMSVSAGASVRTSKGVAINTGGGSTDTDIIIDQNDGEASVTFKVTARGGSSIFYKVIILLINNDITIHSLNIQVAGYSKTIDVNFGDQNTSEITWSMPAATPTSIFINSISLSAGATAASGGKQINLKGKTDGITIDDDAGGLTKSVTIIVTASDQTTTATYRILILNQYLTTLRVRTNGGIVATQDIPFSSDTRVANVGYPSRDALIFNSELLGFTTIRPNLTGTLNRKIGSSWATSTARTPRVEVSLITDVNDSLYQVNFTRKATGSTAQFIDLQVAGHLSRATFAGNEYEKSLTFSVLTGTPAPTEAALIDYGVSTGAYLRGTKSDASIGTLTRNDVLSIIDDSGTKKIVFDVLSEGGFFSNTYTAVLNFQNSDLIFGNFQITVDGNTYFPGFADDETAEVEALTYLKKLPTQIEISQLTLATGINLLDADGNQLALNSNIPLPTVDADGNLKIKLTLSNGTTTRDYFINLVYKNAIQLTAPISITTYETKAIAVSPNQEYVAFAGGEAKFPTMNDAYMSLWKIDEITADANGDTSSAKKTLYNADTTGYNKIYFSPDGTKLLTVHEAGNILLWDVVESTDVVQPIYNTVHSTTATIPVYGGGFSPDSTKFFSVGYENSRENVVDSNLKVYDATGVNANAFHLVSTGHTGTGVRSTAQFGDRLATASKGKVTIHQVNFADPIPASDPNFVSTSDAMRDAIEATTLTKQVDITSGYRQIKAMAFNPAGDRLVTAGIKGQETPFERDLAYVWTDLNKATIASTDASKYTLRLTQDYSYPKAHSISFSSDGKLLLTLGTALKSNDNSSVNYNVIWDGEITADTDTPLHIIREQADPESNNTCFISGVFSDDKIFIGCDTYYPHVGQVTIYQ